VDLRRGRDHPSSLPPSHCPSTAQGSAASSVFTCLFSVGPAKLAAAIGNRPWKEPPMIDEIAIQQTISAWSEATGRVALEEAAATFTPDGIWEIPGGTQFQGHAKIKEGILSFTTPMEFLMQMNAPAVIKITGDTATARSVIREAGRAKGASEG